MKLSAAAFFILISINTWGQKQEIHEEILLDKTPLVEGSITLQSGEKLLGLLKYNENTGILTYGSGSDSRSFITRSVSSFEFFDEHEQRQRIFYSLGPPALKDGFYEIIKELKDFIVLSGVNKLESEQSRYTSPTTYNPALGIASPGRTAYFKNIQFKQIETIYFMDTDGNAWSFMEIIEKEGDGASEHLKTKNRVNEKLLKKFTGDYYKKLKDFIYENDLSLKSKHDLIRVLNYYEALKEL